MNSATTASLGELLTEHRERVAVQSGVRYPIAGVYGFGRGMLLRDSVAAEGIAATSLYRIRAGQIIYSRLKAFEGAFAIVTDAADGRFVSNEFPTFDVDIASAEPHYLALLLRSPRVWAELSELITGVGARRERLPVDEFLAYQVPLPALAVQREVVAKAHLPAALAIRQAAECAATRSLAASMLSGILDGAGGRVVQLGEIAELALDKVDVERHGAYPIAGVKIAGAGLFSREVLSGANTSYSKLTKLSAGQLVYRKLTAWEGPITVVSEPFDGYFVSPEFPTFKLDLEQVDADVLRLICRSPLFHAEMKSLATGTAERRNRLKPEDLLDIEIELPRLTHQAPIGMICRLADALETEAEHAAALSRAVAVGVVRELLQG